MAAVGLIRALQVVAAVGLIKAAQVLAPVIAKAVPRAAVLNETLQYQVKG